MYVVALKLYVMYLSNNIASFLSNLYLGIMTCYYAVFVKPGAFLKFRCIMAFMSLHVCFFGSVEHIKSRSDLRDQFRSTLAGFGKS